jgi:hypothetical protein
MRFINLTCRGIPMSTILLFSVLNAIGLISPTSQPDAAKKELFAKEAWYKSQDGKEQTFVGVVHEVKGGGIGFGRFNPYRLEMTVDGKKDVREIYIGGKPKLMAPYVGKRIKLVGKAVEIGVEGKQHREIWPAWVILEADQAPPQKEGKNDGVKILNQTRWPFVSSNPGGPKQGMQFVIRSQEDWDKRTKKGTAQLEKALMKGLPGDKIDWNKYMIAVITTGVRNTGGYGINIMSAKVKDNELTIHWQETTPKGIVTQAFTHPAVAVLIERFDGKVAFERHGGGGKGKIRPPIKIKPIIR